MSVATIQNAGETAMLDPQRTGNSAPALTRTGRIPHSACDLRRTWSHRATYPQLSRTVLAPRIAAFAFATRMG